MARRSRTRWLGLYLRGAAMGMAEVIPGVSGGTIAFITGIYRELLETIAGLSLRSLARLRDGFGAFWHSANLGFLVVLGAGMGTSIILLARLISTLLETTPLLIWGFFFGLIVAACIDVARHSEVRALLRFGPIGLVVGLLIGVSGAVTLAPTALNVFLGGTIAVTAWILPGISGGYMLLLLGLYAPVIAAVATFDLRVVGALGAGCVVGLALFSRVLAYLMRRHEPAVIAVLTGFMAGSLLKLWPWRVPDGSDEWPALPTRYLTVTEQDPMVGGVLVAMAGGFLALWLLARARDTRGTPSGGAAA